MKNIAITVLMLLFVGVGTSMAQSKTEVTTKEATKTEVKSVEKHKCAAECTKACCSKGKASGAATKADAADKKACAPGCEKACCTADAGKKEDHGHDHDSHDGHTHP